MRLKKIDQIKLNNLKISEPEISDLFFSINLNDHYNQMVEESKLILPLTKDKKFPPFENQLAISLVILNLFREKLISKNSIASVGSKYLGVEQTDWQPRHLSTQYGFHVLNKGDNIPNTIFTVPSGFHSLLTLTSISPRYIAAKRIDLLDKDDFEDIKKLFDYRCAHCGSKENETNLRDGNKCRLQKGHMDPNSSLIKGNIITLCNYCNQTYKDKFYFSPNGSINKNNFHNEQNTKEALRGMISIWGQDRLKSWI